MNSEALESLIPFQLEKGVCAIISSSLLPPPFPWPELPHVSLNTSYFYTDKVSNTLGQGTASQHIKQKL